MPNTYTYQLLTQLPDVGEVHLVLAKEPEFGPALAQNKRLSHAGWADLWPKQRKSLDSAVSLVSRSLNEEQRRLVLAKERRAKVLTSYIQYNQPTSKEDVDAILGASTAQQVLSDLLAVVEKMTTPEAADLHDYIGRQLTGIAALCWAATTAPDRVSDAEVLTILDTMSEWWGKSKAFGRRAAALRQLFDTRPSLIDPAVHDGADESVLTAISGCRHLASPEVQARLIGLDPETHELVGPLKGSKYGLLALANNPRTQQFVLTALVKHSIEGDVGESVSRRRGAGRPTVETAFEDVEDQMILAWLIKRSAPFWSSYTNETSPGKPFEVAALAANTHLADEQALQVAKALNTDSVDDALGTVRANALLALMKERYPDLPEDLTAPRSLEPVEVLMHNIAEDPMSDEAIDALVLETKENPVHYVLRRYGYTSDRRIAFDRALTEDLGTDPRAWELLVKMVEAHYMEPLGSLAATCRRLASVNANAA